MCFECATLTANGLEKAIARVVRYPHGDVHKGNLVISEDVFSSPERETNLVISPYSFFDCTGSIHVGPWCNIGPRTRIYTHDHVHMGKQPLSTIQEKFGVLWQDKYIGSDVWIHDGSLVLYQVTHIPDGVIIGGGSVLTRNPKPYEIWAGNPARKIGERTSTDSETIKRLVCREAFSLESMATNDMKEGRI